MVLKETQNVISIIIKWLENVVSKGYNFTQYYDGEIEQRDIPCILLTVFSLQ